MKKRSGSHMMIMRSNQILKCMSPYTADVLDPFVLKQKLSVLDVLKSVVLSVTLLPIRLLLMLFILVLAWIMGAVTMAWTRTEKSLGLRPRLEWGNFSIRRSFKSLVVCLLRCAFFVGGWYWIPQKGRPRAPAKEAPILLVVPHSSFFDIAAFIALGCPRIVVKDTAKTAPIFGSLARYNDSIFVSSGDPDSRRRIAEDIRRGVTTSGEKWDQLLIFPEGGCGNRRALLQFKLGAFSPGVPVQPVFIRYKNKLDTVTWTWDGPGGLKQLWLTLTQFRIGCELEFLPVYRPSNVEKGNPRVFADNVQNFISSWTRTPVSRFSVEDARFVRAARDLHLPPTAPLVKLMRLRKAIGRHLMDPAKELQYLKEKNKYVGVTSGDVEQMAAYLGLERCPESLKDFFRTLDQRGSGTLDMRVYNAGLYLLRTDLEASEKQKLAFQSFGCNSKAEHLEHILLLWKGVPSSLFDIKTVKTSLHKIETEELFSD